MSDFVQRRFWPSTAYENDYKKRKEEIEIKNNAENMVYETEKALGEIGDKIDEAEKKSVEDAKEDLKKALEGNNIDEIKAKTETLTNAFAKISEKIYQAAQNAGFDPNNIDPSQFTQNMGGGTGSSEEPKPDNVVDADYEVVDEDKEDKKNN